MSFDPDATRLDTQLYRRSLSVASKLRKTRGAKRIDVLLGSTIITIYKGELFPAAMLVAERSVANDLLAEADAMIYDLQDQLILVRQELTEAHETIASQYNKGGTTDIDNSDSTEANLRVLYVLDRFGVSDKFYQEISMLFSELPRSSAIKKARTELNDTMDLIRIEGYEGAYRPFESTLCKHLSILIAKNPAVFASGKNFKIRISGDGAKFSRTSNFILLSYAILEPSIGQYLSGLGVEKHNDDAKRNYFSSNRWDAPADIMMTEYRLEELCDNQATGQPLYQLQWTFDDVRKTITFNVVVHTTGWVGFGLSPDGGMVGSDVVIGWVSSDGKTYFHDRYAFAMATPPIDPSQDWTLLSGSESSGYTNLTFTRKWITCDSNDRDIKPDTARVVFSWGAADPADTSLSGQYHGSNRGSVSLNLLGGLVNPPPQPSDAKNFTIAVNQVAIPVQTTTYWCTGFKLPSDIISQKRYITKISPKISPNDGMYVHHMLLYQCLSLNETSDLGMGYDCNKATDTIGSCRLGRPIITAWAVGGNDFIYPNGIAFPIGGRSDEQYVAMEMHYNNPSLTSGVRDSSGFLITYTSIAPTYEAGVLTLGYSVSPLMIIPPRDPSFTVYGTCDSTCTTAAIPSTGINIFANLLHTHLVGRAVTLRHLRMNSSCGGLQELPPVDQNMQYDFNFQQTNLLTSPVNVLPGGESTYDEMCLSFPVYYPRIELGACLSLFDNTNYIPFASSNLAPTDFQALVTLLQTGGFNLYSGIKSIFGTLVWTQQQQSDYQAAGPNGDFYGFCSARNGSYLQQGNPAIAVKCAYSAPDTCQALAATTMAASTMATTAGTAMNLPAMGGLLLTIGVIIMNFF
ncbi:hypothetical protein EMCRGX_G012217 [Ephydatia muelleri]